MHYLNLLCQCGVRRYRVEPSDVEETITCTRCGATMPAIVNLLNGETTDFYLAEVADQADVDYRLQPAVIREPVPTAPPLHPEPDLSKPVP